MTRNCSVPQQWFMNVTATRIHTLGDAPCGKYGALSDGVDPNPRRGPSAATSSASPRRSAGASTRRRASGPGQIIEGSIGITDFDPAQPDSLHVTGGVTFGPPPKRRPERASGTQASRPARGAARDRGREHCTRRRDRCGRARAQVGVDWTPASGLLLEAILSASATSRLRASVTGFAEVVADAFVTSFTLWRSDFTLRSRARSSRRRPRRARRPRAPRRGAAVGGGPHAAQREFGSGLAVGVSVPVAWREASALDFDFDRVQFQVPEISADSALAGLLRDEGSDRERNDA